jgi:hypothetical protein
MLRKMMGFTGFGKTPCRKGTGLAVPKELVNLRASAAEVRLFYPS